MILSQVWLVGFRDLWWFLVIYCKNEKRQPFSSKLVSSSCHQMSRSLITKSHQNLSKNMMTFSDMSWQVMMLYFIDRHLKYFLEMFAKTQYLSTEALLPWQASIFLLDIYETHWIWVMSSMNCVACYMPNLRNIFIPKRTHTSPDLTFSNQYEMCFTWHVLVFVIYGALLLKFSPIPSQIVYM